MPEYLKDISIINHNNKALELEIRSDKSAWHIYFNVLEDMDVFLNRLQMDVQKAIVDVQTRVAEQRDAPDRAEQKCPECNGTGDNPAGDSHSTDCPECGGTGISNRSAGG